MRVYELAKELNVKSVELVDKIRKEWKLPVRSYMEMLTEEQEKQIRKKLQVEQKEDAVKKPSTPKKKVVRRAVKKIVSAVESEETQPVKTPVVKKVIRRKAVEVKPIIIKKETSTPTPTETPTPSSEPVKEERLSLKEKLQTLELSSEELPVEEEKKKVRKFSEKEETLQKFTATDFRKREVIFQQKKKRGPLDHHTKKTIITTPKEHKRVIKFYAPLSVQDLSHQMTLKSKKLIDKLKQEGLSADKDTVLDLDIVGLIAPEFGFEVKDQQKTFEEMAKELQFGDLKEDSVLCPPVVTIMGHVDHGKTTLLDTLRKTSIAEKEAGGITQHIGAYSLPVGSSFITFIDTPGHSAFAEMRARGARLTNIVIIVVAADDGVSSQTVEAVQHAQSAKVPIIVAVNKMDKPGADIEKVKQQMSQHNVVSEEWGGDTLFVPISALTGEGTQNLLEQILLVAEMQEIKANPKQSAQGIVIESRMEKGRGWVADLIVQNGTLKKSDYIMTPTLLGRVRQMMNDRGQNISSMGPGLPVEISGFDEAPLVGSSFFAVKNEKLARDFLLRQKKIIQKSSVAKSADELLQMHISKVKELTLIIKADVGGSLEAIKNSLAKVNSEEVKINIIHAGLGSITESDILLAVTTQAEVIGFSVKADTKSEKLAKDHNVPIWTYTIIYELLDGVKKRAIGVLDPSIVDQECGKAEIREVFSISGLGTIAGSYVLSGKIGRQHLARLVRDGRIVYEGKIDSLRRFKEDVKEVDESFECGIGLERFNDIKTGDVIETFIKKEVARTEL